MACLCIRYNILYHAVLLVRLICHRCGVVAGFCFIIRASGQQTLDTISDFYE